MINDLTSLFLLNHTEEPLHLDPSLLNRRAKVINRDVDGRRVSLFAAPRLLSALRASQYTAKPAREMLRLHF